MFKSQIQIWLCALSSIAKETVPAGQMLCLLAYDSPRPYLVSVAKNQCTPGTADPSPKDSEGPGEPFSVVARWLSVTVTINNKTEFSE
jgi:hypothetical protein